MNHKYPLLEGIEYPADLRAHWMSHQLPAIAQELRVYLLDSVATSGGHFAAGLGAIEINYCTPLCFQHPP